MQSNSSPGDDYRELYAGVNNLFKCNKNGTSQPGAHSTTAYRKAPVGFRSPHHHTLSNGEPCKNLVVVNEHNAVAELDLQKAAIPPATSDEPNAHKICIIGAGVAGLYTAMILDDLAIPNLTYQVVEASSRVGGRIYTHHFSNDKHDYYDVGAMRFPYTPSMRRAFHLFDQTGVPLIPYHINGGESCPKYFNGRFFDSDEVDPHHVGDSYGGLVADIVVAQCGDLLEQIYAPYKQHLKEDFRRGIGELLKADDFSIREYLCHGGPDGTGPKFDFFSIQWMESQLANNGFFDRAFSRGVLKSYFTKDVTWWCIDGGAALLTDSIQKKIKNKVETKKLVTSIAIEGHNTQSSTLSVHIQDESQPRTGFTTVFNTTTLAALARMDLSSLSLHPAQNEAIRSVHYRDAAKVAIKFKYPWWVVHCGLRGGTARTDLLLRECVYPPYNVLDKLDQPSVLLASYTQGQDATRISTLINASNVDGQPLIDLILRDLATLHAKHVTYEMIKDAYSGEYHAYSWGLDPCASGAYASFGPSQYKNFYPYLTRPAAQGRFHIVGEATSTSQGWISGALDSAYSAIHKFLYLHDMEDDIEKLEKRWGHADELKAEFCTKSDTQLGSSASTAAAKRRLSNLY